MLREVAEKLRAARHAAGLTQEEVAEAIEADPTYVQRLEGGRVNPGVLTLARYSRAVRGTLWSVLGGATLAPPRRAGRPRAKQKR